MALSRVNFGSRAQAGKLAYTPQIAYIRIFFLLCCLLPRKAAADPEAGFNSDGVEAELQAERETLSRLSSLDIIVYGDSLPASLRGPDSGARNGTGVPEVWVKHHGHRRTKNMAESSLTAENLQKQIDQENFLQDDHAKQAVVWLGGMDIFYCCGDEDTTTEVVSQRIIGICARLMRHTPGIKIVLMAIMPRGRGIEHEWVETFEELAPLPNAFSAQITAINQRLEAYAREQDAITFLDCTPWFITDNPEVPGGIKINTKLVPDVLHFNAQGFDLVLSECLDPVLNSNN